MNELELYNEVKTWAANAARGFKVGNAIDHEDLTQEAYLVCREVQAKYESKGLSQVQLLRAAKKAIKNRYISIQRYHTVRSTEPYDEETVPTPTLETAFEVLIVSDLLESVKSKLNARESCILDCFLRTPEGVLLEAQVQFKEAPEVQVPDRMIANHLGISPFVLSRFKTKLKVIINERTRYEQDLQ